MTSDVPPTVDVSPAAPIEGAVGDTRTVPGPGALAGAFVFATALQRADIDPQTQARLLKALGDTLPLKPLQPGTAATDRTLPAASLSLLIPSAAVVAAGLDPAAVIPPVPPVLWSTDAGQHQRDNAKHDSDPAEPHGERGAADERDARSDEEHCHSRTGDDPVEVV